jgi:hypothetical protein
MNKYQSQGVASPKYFDITQKRNETEMKFLEVEIARELEVWPPVPEIVEVPKMKVMSDLIIGKFSLNSLRMHGLCSRCETGSHPSLKPCPACIQ